MQELEQLRARKSILVGNYLNIELDKSKDKTDILHYIKKKTSAHQKSYK